MSIPVKTRGDLSATTTIVIFLLLAMALGSGTIFLVVIGVLPSNLAIGSMLSASIAGVIMTAVEDGRAGLKLLFNRLLIWRVGVGYWLFALAFILLPFLLGSLANPLFSGDPMSFSNLGGTFPVLPMFILFVIGAGLGQELGWTGYLLPRLQSRFSALVSSLIRTAFVALWHLPLFLFSIQDPASLADLPYGGWIAQKGFFVAFGTATLLFMLPWSMFFTWLFNNTRGSVLVVAVFHGSEILVVYWMLRAGIDPRNLDNYWGYGVILVAAALLILVTTGAQDLSQEGNRVKYASAIE